MTFKWGCAKMSEFIIRSMYRHMNLDLDRYLILQCQGPHQNLKNVGANLLMPFTPFKFLVKVNFLQ